jgi:hypothetical protein
LTDAAAQPTLQELQDQIAAQKTQIEAQEQRLAVQQLDVEAQRKLLQSVQKQLDALTASQDDTLVEDDAIARDDDPAAAPESLDLGDDAVATLDDAASDNATADGETGAGDDTEARDDDAAAASESLNLGDNAVATLDNASSDDATADANTDTDTEARDDDAAAAPESLDLGDKQVTPDLAADADKTQVAVVPKPLNLGEDFRNAIRLPDGTSALKVGGFVKMSLVDSFDPIGSTDRFVTASIPVVITDANSNSGQFAVTARQSRLNFDMRQKTTYGTFRAFVEGDFAADGDTYRLRHAFGQYRQFLAGKTYSTFVDSTSQPDEIDFEGINGRINVRQALIRYFPSAGRDANFLVALEDPQPDVTNGSAISKIPDTIFSWRRLWRKRWHVKTSILLRQVEAQWDVDPSVSDRVFGWGASVSGSASFGNWNVRDKFLFQLNYGDGYGRYVNDLKSLTGHDGVFDPDTGKLKTFKVYAGYLSFRHWWKEKLRSSLTYSWVHVDNFDFEPDEAYAKTKRASMNLIWSPIVRVDLGSELIWGERENANGDSATALQVQFSAKYKF